MAHKGPERGFQFQSTACLEQVSLPTAIRSLNELLKGSEFEEPDCNQTVVDANAILYRRMTLRNGTSHWIVGFLTSDEGAWFAALASDPSTGIWYKLYGQLTEIVSYEEIPPELVEIMPEPERPFGFAAHVQNKDGENENGS